MSTPHHDPDYERPIRSRYLDPVELVWLATSRRLGLHVRRDPTIFSRTDGTGLMAFGPRDTLDPDDSLAQMVFHEICHWITNGLESFHVQDWGFPLDDAVSTLEHACLRLQASLADAHGLRQVMAPSSGFRQYYDRIPANPLEALDDSLWEQEVVAQASVAMARAKGEPWAEPIQAALAATRAVRDAVQPFLGAYASEVPDDPLPSLWSR